MESRIFFTVIGYLSGSILSARVFARLLGKPEILEHSKDGNPGTANAFQYGGFLCGTLTLLGDLAKGFLPVYCFLRLGGNFSQWPLLSTAVLVAPVLGHAFPVFFRFRGGKGIAVTFGCLLGLFPYCVPALTLAVCFILFSVVVRVKTHFHRTIVSYMVTLVCLVCLGCETEILLAFFAMTAIVLTRLHFSKEERQKFEVKLLWMH